MLQFGSDCSENSQLWWTGGSEGATLKYQIYLPESGMFDVSGAFTVAGDYGIFELYIDGVKVGEAFDGYNNGVARKQVSFGAVELESGYHEVTFKIVGKNEKAIGYMVGIDYVDVKKKD